ncbi:hypothetical protein V5735_20375 (plasmid) [Haladaptatus sp. SPP-AMP-3]|uniref:hypothetical protein n=1 Tax=Haladaptatus sp. SPP-AMP-3 TaxID=3121295 RepID=UPI003C2D4DF9
MGCHRIDGHRDTGKVPKTVPYSESTRRRRFIHAFKGVVVSPAILYEVDLPDKEARKLIFRVRLRELPSNLDDEDFETLAEQTADRSAADIVGIVDDPAMRAAERDAEAITKDDLLEYH